VVLDWTGFTGGPGVSVFYTGGVGSGTSDLRVFFDALKAFFPSALTINFPTSGDTIDDSSGIINGVWSSGAVASVVGTGAGAYAAGVGTWVDWRTNGVVGHRRVQGRTFLAPMVIGAFDTNGTMFATTLTAIGTAAATLVATGDLSIWHRPPVGTFSGGSGHVVTGYRTRDQVTSLRTRRT